MWYDLKNDLNSIIKTFNIERSASFLHMVLIYHTSLIIFMLGKYYFLLYIKRLDSKSYNINFKIYFIYM